MDRYSIVFFFVFVFLFLGVFSFYNYSGITSATTFVVGEDIPLINPPDSVKEDDDKSSSEPQRYNPVIIVKKNTTTEEEDETEIIQNTAGAETEVDETIENETGENKIIKVQEQKSAQTFAVILIAAILFSVVSVFVYERYFRKEVHPKYRSMDELKKYFDVGLKKGHSIDKLRDALVKQDVPEGQIELVLKDLRKF